MGLSGDWLPWPGSNILHRILGLGIQRIGAGKDERGWARCRLGEGVGWGERCLCFRTVSCIEAPGCGHLLFDHLDVAWC